MTIWDQKEETPIDLIPLDPRIKESNPSPGETELPTTLAVGSIWVNVTLK